MADSGQRTVTEGKHRNDAGLPRGDTRLLTLDRSMLLTVHRPLVTDHH